MFIFCGNNNSALTYFSFTDVKLHCVHLRQILCLFWMMRNVSNCCVRPDFESLVWGADILHAYWSGSQVRTPICQSLEGRLTKNPASGDLICGHSGSGFSCVCSDSQTEKIKKRILVRISGGHALLFSFFSFLTIRYQRESATAWKKRDFPSQLVVQ